MSERNADIIMALSAVSRPEYEARVARLSRTVDVAAICDRLNEFILEVDAAEDATAFRQLLHEVAPDLAGAPDVPPRAVLIARLAAVLRGGEGSPQMVVALGLSCFLLRSEGDGPDTPDLHAGRAEALIALATQSRGEFGLRYLTEVISGVAALSDVDTQPPSARLKRLEALALVRRAQHGEVEGGRKDLRTALVVLAPLIESRQNDQPPVELGRVFALRASALALLGQWEEAEQADEHLMQADKDLAQALTLFEGQKGCDDDIVKAGSNLGLIRFRQSNRSNGQERVELSKSAVEAFETALTGVDVSRSSDAFCTIHMNRANVLMSSANEIGGHEAEQLFDKALQGFNAARAQLSHVPDDYMLALVQTNQASLHAMRAAFQTGAAAVAELDKAIANFDDALKVQTSTAFPGNFASTQMNRSNALVTRSRGQIGQPRKNDLTAAIHGFDKALQIQTKADAPDRYAHILLSRARAWRLLGNEASGQEAFAHYDRALDDSIEAARIRTAEASPFDHAEIQSGIADLYLSRQAACPDHKAKADLTAALSACDAVLAAYSEEHAKSHYFRALLDRITVLEMLAQRETPAKAQKILAKAVQDCERAEEALASDEKSRDFADCLFARARCLALMGPLRGGQSGQDDLATAITTFRQVLGLWPLEADPVSHVKVSEKLAQALLDHARIGAAGECRAQRVEAGEIFARIRAQYDPRTRCRAWLNATLNLARAMKETGDAQSQVALLEAALKIGREQVLSGHDPLERRAIIHSLAGVADRLFLAQLDRGCISEAASAISMGRGIQSNADMTLAKITGHPTCRPAAEAYRQVSSCRENLSVLHRDLAELRASAIGDGKLQQQLNSLRQAADKEQEQLAQAERGFEATMLELGLPLAPPVTGFDELKRSVPERGAIVILAAGDTSGAALIVLSDASDSQIVALPEFSRETLARLFTGSEAAGELGWNGICDQHRSDVMQSQSGQVGLPLNDQAFGQMHQRLRGFLGRLWEGVMGPLHLALEDCGLHDAEVVLLPPGQLAVMPLHMACPSDEPIEDNAFFVHWASSVAMSPQALVQAVCEGSKIGSDAPALLAVSDPGLNLNAVAAESNVPAQTQIRNPAWEAFSPSRRTELFGDKATTKDVLSALPRATHASFFCHGCWDPVDPAQSGLLMAPGQEGAEDPHSADLLSLVQLMQAERQTFSQRLWFLGACDTAPLNQDLPDEFLGLAAGISSRVPAVVATLYPVTNWATEKFGRAFFRAHLDQELSPARAFQQVLKSAMSGGFDMGPELDASPAPSPAPGQEGHYIPMGFVPASEPALSLPMFGAGVGGGVAPDAPASKTNLDTVWSRWLSHWSSYVLLGC